MCCSVAVVGIGNILLRDDGIGVHLVRQLAGDPRLPAAVACIDGGTASYETLRVCRGYGRIIIADAVRAGGDAGTIYMFDFKDWVYSQQVSVHSISFLDALHAAQKLRGFQTTVKIIGMEPGDLSPGLGLSFPIKKRLQVLADQILKEVAAP